MHNQVCESSQSTVRKLCSLAAGACAQKFERKGRRFGGRNRVPTDSSARRWSRINKIYNLIPPTIVAWLLKYSGSKVEHRDGFSSCR